MATLGERVRARRAELGMTQDGLARATGIAQTLISRYENDVQQPRLDRAAKLAEGLECTLDDLFRAKGSC